MDENTTNNQLTDQPGVTGLTVRRALRIFVFLAIIGAIMFGSAGTLDWPMAWAYLGAYGIFSITGVFVMLKKQPDLIDERADVPEDAIKWDRVLTTIMIPLSILVPPLVAGLDVRFGWSRELPLWVQIAALALFIVAQCFSFWASLVNKFYSRVIRIQTDRGHVVVTDGPYRYVRHPGYSGQIVTNLMLPVALGTLWVFVPNAIMLVMLVVRTELEDRTLQEELPGYKEYTTQTRYRLIPGIW